MSELHIEPVDAARCILPTCRRRASAQLDVLPWIKARDQPWPGRASHVAFCFDCARRFYLGEFSAWELLRWKAALSLLEGASELQASTR